MSTEKHAWVKAQSGVICTFKAHVETRAAVFYQIGTGKGVCSDCAVSAGALIDPEETPLGRAAAAIRAAEQALGDAYDAACADNKASYEAYCDYDVELRPDTDSLGFEAVYTYAESIGPPLAWLESVLSAACREHGIVSISKVGTYFDSSYVDGFKD